jgi:phosphoribosylamine--glycine ligase
MFALCDGIHYQLLPEAKDYKRIFDGDQGPNTGGMGSVSPVWFVDELFTQKVEERVLKPLFKTLEKKGLYYKGFLFVGLMKVGNDPFVIEFNARLGDPETQTILNRIEGDLVPALLSLKTRTLDKHPVQVKSRAVASVVLCAENYPDTPVKGDAISLLEADQHQRMYVAGANRKDGKLVTSGGRVLVCTGWDVNLESALAQAYSAVENVSFRGMQFRKDIGKDLMNSGV